MYGQCFHFSYQIGVQTYRETDQKIVNIWTVFPLSYQVGAQTYHVTDHNILNVWTVFPLFVSSWGTNLPRNR